MTEPRSFRESSGNPFEDLTVRGQLDPTLLDEAEALYMGWRARQDQTTGNAINRITSGLNNLFDRLGPPKQETLQMLGRTVRVSDLPDTPEIIDFVDPADRRPMSIFTFLDSDGPGVYTYGGYGTGHNHFVDDLYPSKEEPIDVSGPVLSRFIAVDQGFLSSYDITATPQIVEGQVAEAESPDSGFGPTGGLATVSELNPVRLKPGMWDRTEQERSPVDFTKDVNGKDTGIGAPTDIPQPQNNSQEGDN